MKNQKVEMVPIDTRDDDTLQKIIEEDFSLTPPPSSPKAMPKYDNVNRPKHYTQGKIDCIDAMVEAFGVEAVKTFCKCNAFKYLWRSEHKNGVEDIEKARWYTNKYVELCNK